ncbi:MAG: permease [Bacillota bacterium]
MQHQVQAQGNRSSAETTPLSGLWPLGLFLAIAVAGLFIVKWNPYYHKAFLAAAKHSIGSSILSGSMPVAPTPSWGAALEYTLAYFKAVWKAILLGLTLGSLIETLLPKGWLQRFLGKGNFRSTFLGGMAAIPSMMCTCCAAPMAVGLRKQSVSVGSALAYWLGNPVLNPATFVFMGFVLSWPLAIFRLVFGLIIVFGVAYAANRLAGDEKIMPPVSAAPLLRQEGHFLVRWLKSFYRLAVDSLPIYILMVVLLGALRAWIFPQVAPEWENSFWVILAFAVAGTFFIIPTAAEIPIVQTMLSFGLGIGPAAALLLTLPTISLPSLFIVKKAFPARVLVFVTISVIALGLAGGLIAKFVFL